MSELRSRVLELVRTRGHESREEPFTLSSGETSYDYVDGKRAVAEGEHLRIACEAIIELVEERGEVFEAVGGLTMGAEALSHGVALLANKKWFSVRKEPKKHGKQRLLEGAALRPGMPVLVVDDVVTTGKSILQAIHAIEAEGAEVVLAVTLIDRGDAAAKLLADRGISYTPLTTYRDIGIAPVGGG